MVKIEMFGFENEETFVFDILKSQLLFSDVPNNTLRQMSDPKFIVSLEKNKSLFVSGQTSDGIYVLIEGMAKELFSEEIHKTHYLGSLLGISSLINERHKYDTAVRCESACRLVFIPLETCTMLFNTQERFELNCYLFYLHHYINFLKQNFDLLEVG